MALTPYINEHFSSNSQPVILSVHLNLHSKNELVTAQSFHEGNTWRNKALSQLRALTAEMVAICGYYDSVGKLLSLPFPLLSYYNPLLSSIECLLCNANNAKFLPFFCLWHHSHFDHLLIIYCVNKKYKKYVDMCKMSLSLTTALLGHYNFYPYPTSPLGTHDSDRC